MYNSSRPATILVRVSYGREEHSTLFFPGQALTRSRRLSAAPGCTAKIAWQATECAGSFTKPTRDQLMIDDPVGQQIFHSTLSRALVPLGSNFFDLSAGHDSAQAPQLLARIDKGAKK
jgi:hypothetical protein